MDPVTISALVAGATAIGQLIQKLIAAKDADAAAVLADLNSELAKMKATLDAGGSLDQAFAADDAKLDKAIADAEAPTKP